jgi:hypothetical protein
MSKNHAYLCQINLRVAGRAQCVDAATLVRHLLRDILRRAAARGPRRTDNQITDNTTTGSYDVRVTGESPRSRVRVGKIAQKRTISHEMLA